MPRLLKTDPGMTHCDRLDFTDDPVGGVYFARPVVLCRCWRVGLRNGPAVVHVARATWLDEGRFVADFDGSGNPDVCPGGGV